MPEEHRKVELLEMSILNRFILSLVLILSSLQLTAAPPIFLDNPESAFALSEDLEIDVFLLFTAGWCPSCLIMKNDIHNSLDNFSDIIFCYVDYDKYKDMAKQYQVTILPDYRIYRKKVEIAKKTGYKNKEELLQWIKKTNKN